MFYPPLFKKVEHAIVINYDDILKLPPYELDLNPGEMIWALIKQCITMYSKQIILVAKKKKKLENCVNKKRMLWVTLSKKQSVQM